MMTTGTIGFLMLGSVSFCYLHLIIVQKSIMIFYSFFFKQKKHIDLFSSFTDQHVYCTITVM